MNTNVDDIDPESDGPQADDPGAANDDALGARAAAADAPDVEGLAAERDALRERLLRTTAEFDNFRKRVERERREMAERAAEDVLRDLLPIVDDLERALEVEAADESAGAYRAGVELIHRQILDLLARRGVTPVEALGQQFDPHLHQAVATEPAGDYEDGAVIEELRRGYRLGDRLLRATMVKVAKA